MSDQKQYMHQSIAQAVCDHGIDTMFGLVGDANLFLANHFVNGCSGTMVPAAHEGGTVLMAQAYAQVTGKVGVATVTQGPGLTNCFTALREGVVGRSPIILLCGDTPATAPFHPQNIDQREVVKATGAGFEQVKAPETAARDVATAFYRARKERRPIVVNIPTDFMWAEVEHKPVVFPLPETHSTVTEGPVHEEAIGMIASAKRPLILAGAGAASAKDKLIALSERLEAPLATTLKGTGLFAGHPNNIGYFGTLSTAEAYDVIGAADCVIVFGAWMHFLTTDRGELLKGKRVIQVNNSLSDAGAFYQPDAVLIADAGQTADNILHWMDEAEVAPSGFTRELPSHDISKHPKGDPDKSEEGCINLEYALDRLNEALPKNRIMLTDGGRYITEVWCRVSVPDPNSFHMTDNFAAIGQGMQQAIGAAHGDPSRPVVLFMGDGGFMMGGANEFNTAVRTKRDLIVIICNDSAYGAEHIQMLDRQMDPSLTEFNWPSFAEVAKAMGGEGVQVTSPEELETAIAAINARKGPIIVDLKLDPNSVPRMRM
ncbi:thiamine pyrophosphate-binding protein [Rhodalgimonas zhirmunskyi]|uniref:Thiamine pyrophosphate-binding protein n=1 Tax=Rhodalgimonas zhirmunskyi TaxID=2964767 RepID=A0AAJ1U9R3_9RHOB|nr:thiamine pyrophosphate-binding protein [Rhodoalgimonas zhirmunskyi]MDQ2095564.1 thiamine pyrophosphate-binding protein [Rhodoalgimonas zhirmunskyi]